MLSRFCLLFFLSVCSCWLDCGATVDIVAAVGNRAISTMDILEHANALRVLNGGQPITRETWNEFAVQALSDLTDVVILENRAKENRWNVTPKMVDDYLVNVRYSMHMTSEQMKLYMEENQINADALALAVRVRLLWQRVVETEVEPKVKFASEAEVADFVEGMRNNVKMTNSVHKIRYVNMARRALIDGSSYARRVSSFVEQLRSCGDADALAEKYDIGKLSPELEVRFRDLDPNVQMSLISISEPMISTVMPIRDGLQIMVVCSYAPGEEGDLDAVNDLSVDRINGIIMQHKRSQLFTSAMNRVRSGRFIDVKTLPTYDQYIAMYHFA